MYTDFIRAFWHSQYGIWAGMSCQTRITGNRQQLWWQMHDGVCTGIITVG